MFSALFLNKVCDVLSVRGREGGSWDVKSGSRGFQSDTAKILPIRDLFSNSRTSLCRAVFFVVNSLVFVKQIFASVPKLLR